MQDYFVEGLSCGADKVDWPLTTSPFGTKVSGLSARAVAAFVGREDEVVGSAFAVFGGEPSRPPDDPSLEAMENFETGAIDRRTTDGIEKDGLLGAADTAPEKAREGSAKANDHAAM